MNVRPQLLFVIIFLISGCVENSESLSAQERLYIFYEKDIPESGLMPFLVEGGSEIVPLLIVDMQKKTTPKRRYIIGAAGELMDIRALPALKSIVINSNEEDYFRCDALKAIDQIEPNYLDEDVTSDTVKNISSLCNTNKENH